MPPCRSERAKGAASLCVARALATRMQLSCGPGTPLVTPPLLGPLTEHHAARRARAPECWQRSDSLLIRNILTGTLPAERALIIMPVCRPLPVLRAFLSLRKKRLMLRYAFSRACACGRVLRLHFLVCFSGNRGCPLRRLSSWQSTRSARRQMTPEERKAVLERKAEKSEKATQV